MKDSEVIRLFDLATEMNKEATSLNKYVIITSTASNFGYRGNDILLQAKVFEEGLDITASLDPVSFRWKRTSACSSYDAVWNNTYSGCKNALADNMDYYARNAIYSVEILD